MVTSDECFEKVFKELEAEEKTVKTKRKEKTLKPESETIGSNGESSESESEITEAFLTSMKKASTYLKQLWEVRSPPIPERDLLKA